MGRGKAEGGEKIEYDCRREHGFAELKRVEVPCLPFSERRAGFAEIELGIDEAPMLAEARRCLQCDLEIGLAREKRALENGR